jgi:hypothetical protein
MTDAHHGPGIGRRGVLAGLAGGSATVAWKQPGNNNHVLELQSAGGAALGEVGSSSGAIALSG